MRLRSVGERSAMLFMRVGFRLEEDARWRLNVKSHRAVRIGTSGSVDFLEGVAQPIGGALVAFARRRLGQAEFDASFGLAETFDRHADH